MRRKDFLKKFYIPKDFSHLLDPVGKPLTKEETAFVACYDRREFMKKTAKALIWTLGAGAMWKLWQPKPAHASRLFNGSTEALEISSAVLSAYPITVSAWFRVDQLATTKGDEMVIFSIGHSSTGSQFISIRVDDGDAQDRLQIIVNNAGAVNALTSNEITAQTWHHAFGVWTSSTLRTVILDGDVANKGTNTTSKTFPSVNITNVAKLRGGGSSFDFFDGRIAEVALWDVALTDNEGASLAAGVSPYRVRSGNMVNHWPVYGRNSPEPDYIGGSDFSLLNAPTQADHSPGMPSFALSNERAFSTGVVTPTDGIRKPNIMRIR